MFINIEGNSLKLVRPPSLPSWEDAPKEVKALVRELKANKQEAVCFLLWRTMLDRCNRDYRPGALAWCRQHFPELVKSLFEAEQQYQTAYWQQDVESCRQAAAAWEAGLRRIVSLYSMAGKVLEAI